ncbi:transposase [Streptosporangium sp. NPDC001681]|uniref:transposase n=1 Tax=Streptosporangium sp. NPDC001681 TaxID=3154395 RepID=UPI003324346C
MFTVISCMIGEDAIRDGLAIGCGGNVGARPERRLCAKRTAAGRQTKAASARAAESRDHISRDHGPSAAPGVLKQCAPRTIAEVAREFGVHDTTLGNWVNTYKRTRAEEEPHSLSGPERARLRELERENSELREKLSFLKKAAAFFAAENNR